MESRMKSESMAGNLFEKGHSACAGCGAAILMRHIVNTLGPDVIVVNSTGCMEIVSSKYPESAWNVPYIHSLFENGPAVASGIARCLRAQGNDHTRVVYIGGDGASYDIGFGALSGALERNEDVIFVIYDTECYSNTGVQRSGATPRFANTTTSPVGKKLRGKQETRKHIGLIAAAHNIAYVATASVGNLPDLKRKLLKAKGIRGSSVIIIYATCTFGWKFDTNLTIKMARLAMQSGMWKLYEFDNGRLIINVEPTFEGLEEYFSLQRRYRHISPTEIEIIKKDIKADWEFLKAMTR
ncbi:MAG: thiamine pyrophosphate-dependent enzyme [Candidatus Micrarchaeia archaeon]